MFCIMNKGQYVKDTAKFGGSSSYTNDPRMAQTFSTEEEARRNACGDESVRKMSIMWV